MGLQQRTCPAWVILDEFNGPAVRISQFAVMRALVHHLPLLPRGAVRRIMYVQVAQFALSRLKHVIVSCCVLRSQ